MRDAWYENMENGELNGAVFVDIRKAFDSINHGILLHKMKETIWNFKYRVKNCLNPIFLTGNK